MTAAMDRLEIDEGIRRVISQLWNHGYTTIKSCSGHGLEAYILITGGDGWFEDHSQNYGLAKVVNGPCCIEEFEADVRKSGFDPKDFVDQRSSCGCGAGVNGNSAYRGKLV